MAKRARNEGTIFRRKDGRWAAALSLGWLGGKRRRKYFYGETQQEVCEARDKERARIDREGRASIELGRGTSLGSYAERWLDDIAPQIKARTLASYRQLLSLHILPVFGRKKLRDIQRRQVKEFLTQKRKGLSKNTVRLIRACMSTLYSDAIEDGLTAMNPAIAMSRRAGKRADSFNVAERQKAIRPLSEIELAQFLAAGQQDADYYPLFLTLARAGLRPGEAFALKWSDLNFDRREILVERALSRGQLGSTKTGTTRLCDMSQELAAALREWEIRRKREKLRQGWKEMPQWVFQNRDGKPLDESKARKRFVAALTRAGLRDHRLYDLRHTFATTLLKNRAPITYVAAQLGHGDPATTLRWYARWLPNDDKSYVDSLDRTRTSDLPEPGRAEVAEK
jgi:integrase